MSVTVDDKLRSAVGDPTRRRVIDLLLAGGGGTATSLGDHLPVTRQGVAKHLAVAQFSEVGTAWNSRLHRIKRIAETIQRSATTTKPHASTVRRQS